MNKPLYKAIATALTARANCAEPNGSAEWYQRWEERLDSYDKLLPSGAGFDAGSRIDRDRSDDTKFVIETSFHHMDEHGGYDGWTEHRISVKPNLLHDIVLTIDGRDRNDIKDYMAETFDYTLREEIDDGE